MNKSQMLEKQKNIGSFSFLFSFFFLKSFNLDLDDRLNSLETKQNVGFDPFRS